MSLESTGTGRKTALGFSPVGRRVSAWAVGEVFDKRSWHEDAGDSAGHIGAFVEWARTRGLDKDARVEAGPPRGPTLTRARGACENVGPDDFNENGRAFASVCYPTYLAACEELFVGTHPLAGKRELDRACAYLDELFAAWSAEGEPRRPPRSAGEILDRHLPPLEAERATASSPDALRALLGDMPDAFARDARVRLSALRASALALGGHAETRPLLLSEVARGAFWAAALCYLELEPNASGARAVLAAIARRPLHPAHDADDAREEELCVTAPMLGRRLFQLLGGDRVSVLDEELSLAIARGDVPPLHLLSLVAACPDDEGEAVSALTRTYAERVAQRRCEPAFVQVLERVLRTEYPSGPPWVPRERPLFDLLTLEQQRNLVATLPTLRDRLLVPRAVKRIEPSARGPLAEADVERVRRALDADRSALSALPEREQREVALELVHALTPVASDGRFDSAILSLRALLDELRGTVEVREELLAASRRPTPIPDELRERALAWMLTDALPGDIEAIERRADEARRPDRQEELRTLLAAYRRMR